jgi:hypothetical protein
MYIPGYGDMNVTRELRDLKIKTDSLEQAMHDKDQYLLNLKNVLQGNTSLKIDTTALEIPKAENIDD